MLHFLRALSGVTDKKILNFIHDSDLSKFNSTANEGKITNCLFKYFAELRSMKGEEYAEIPKETFDKLARIVGMLEVVDIVTNDTIKNIDIFKNGSKTEAIKNIKEQKKALYPND